MIRFRHLTLALLGSMALAPAAFAQDASYDSTTEGAKRFAVVGSFAVSEPTSDPVIAGARAQFDGGTAATLSASYYLNDNLAVEAWGAADKFDHRVRNAQGGKIASVDAQPYALSAQYHFGNREQIVRPFVGVGYFENNYSGETPEPTAALAGQRIAVETAKGPMATAGIDVALSPSWFARADLRYMHGDSDARINGIKVGDADLKPMVVSLGLGARF